MIQCDISTRKYRPLTSFSSTTTVVMSLGIRAVFLHPDDISLIWNNPDMGEWLESEHCAMKNNHFELLLDVWGHCPGTDSCSWHRIIDSKLPCWIYSILNWWRCIWTSSFWWKQRYAHAALFLSRTFPLNHLSSSSLIWHPYFTILSPRSNTSLFRGQIHCKQGQLTMSHQALNSLDTETDPPFRISWTSYYKHN